MNLQVSSSIIQNIFFYLNYCPGRRIEVQYKKKRPGQPNGVLHNSECSAQSKAGSGAPSRKKKSGLQISCMKLKLCSSQDIPARQTSRSTTV